MWLHYTGPITQPLPLGLYDHPSDVLGIESVRISDNTVSRTLRDATRFLRRLHDVLPGADDFFEIALGG